MKPYPVDAPRFCKNCKQMRLVEYGADKISANMHCCSGIKWIVDSYVDGHGHWDTNASGYLPWCVNLNADGKCKHYIPKE